MRNKKTNAGLVLPVLRRVPWLGCLQATGGRWGVGQSIHALRNIGIIIMTVMIIMIMTIMMTIITIIIIIIIIIFRAGVSSHMLLG